MAFASHSKYWFQSGNKAGCGPIEYHEDCCNKYGAPVISSDFTCGSWQKGETGSVNNETKDDDDVSFTEYARCYCDAACLSYPTNPMYNDDPTPKNNGSDNDINKITLPVALSWNHVAGWKNLGKNVATVHYYGYESDQSHHSTGYTGYLSSIKGVNNFGPQSYLVEIQDTTSESGINELNFKDDSSSPNIGYASPASEKNVKKIGGKDTYYKVVGTNIFNSVTDAWACFFNSNHSYRWRVKPCCDTQGTVCKEYGDGEGWWYFSTGTPPELISPLDPDWNSGKAVTESFKKLVESENPLRWCSAKLPESTQEAGQPVKYAGSYELYVTSDEDNSITDEIVGSVIEVATNFWNWITGGSSTEEETVKKTHSLSIVNGEFIYDILPDRNSGDVNTWFPAQSRGDLAYFTRERTYTWKLRSCVDADTFDCYRKDNPEYSQEWKITTSHDDVDPPAAISPKDVSTCGNDRDCACETPVGFPINIVWSMPAGANSFVYETDIDNFGGERKTIWNTIPNNGKEFDGATRKLLTLDNAAMKLDTVYRWRAQSCVGFDSGLSNPADCDAWSATDISSGYAFCTTGRPPKTSSMTPGGLTTDITFPQNFIWEKVSGAKSYNVELYDSNNTLVVSRTVKFGDNDNGQPSLQFDYPNIAQPAESTQNISYTWKVQTCADEEGKRCGPNWSSQYFVINRVPKPTLKNATTEFGSLKDMNLAWEGKTRYNLVTITYSGSSPQEGCSTGTVITSYRTQDGNCSMANSCVDPKIKASCVGTYEYKIQPCVDPNCGDRGEGNALTGTFTVGSLKDSTSLANFTVCGQGSDNLDTAWDESVDCSFGSVFLLIKLIINFLLFKVAFLLLPVLALISGGMFYLGMNGKDTIPTVKNIWKYAGIGYAVMFMAWLVVSWLLAIIGYEGVTWWQVF